MLEGVFESGKINFFQMRFKKYSFKNISAVVMVQGGAANDQLYHSLCDSKPCHLIGDAMAQRRVNDAINEGELVARQI